MVSIIPEPESPNTAVSTLLETAQSRTATGGVYKGQGRNQRELMTHTY
uniref:Transposase n=1 Tax=Heterorhabditis bacteriophora TaxID=37862 RepID=A0A1I7WKT2_HETBA